jgi:peptidoglycan hydrolase-like protein with peptidoglycan-binding domain
MDYVLDMARGNKPVDPSTKPPGETTGHPPYPGTLLVNYIEGHGTQTWQAQMSARGWHITVDDKYGNQSEQVCTQFQQEKGLGVDGIVGPETWDAAWTAPIT